MKHDLMLKRWGGGIAEVGENVYSGVVRRYAVDYTDDEANAIVDALFALGSIEEKDKELLKQTLSMPIYYIGGAQDSIEFIKFTVTDGQLGGENVFLPADNKLNNTTLSFGDDLSIDYIQFSQNFISVLLQDSTIRVHTDNISPVASSTCLMLTRTDNGKSVWLHSSSAGVAVGYGSIDDSTAADFITEKDVGKEVKFTIDRYYLEYNEGITEFIPYGESNLSHTVKVTVNVSSRSDAGSIKNLITNGVVNVKKGQSVTATWCIPTNIWAIEFSMLNAWWNYTPELTGKIKARVKSTYDTEWQDYDYVTNGAWYNGDSQFMLSNAITEATIELEFG